MIPVRKDQEIVRVGQDGDYFYVVHSGAAKVIVNPGAGKKEQIILLKVGDYFGDVVCVSILNDFVWVVYWVSCCVILSGYVFWVIVLGDFCWVIC